MIVYPGRKQGMLFFVIVTLSLLHSGNGASGITGNVFSIVQRGIKNDKGAPLFFTRDEGKDVASAVPRSDGSISSASRRRQGVQISVSSTNMIRQRRNLVGTMLLSSRRAEKGGRSGYNNVQRGIRNRWCSAGSGNSEDPSVAFICGFVPSSFSAIRRRTLGLPPSSSPCLFTKDPHHSAAAAAKTTTATAATTRKNSITMMVRNVDLPECIIFYGMDGIIDMSNVENAARTPTPHRGVVRILRECEDVGTAAILLSETRTSDQARNVLERTVPDTIIDYETRGVLHIRSSLQEHPVPAHETNDNDDEYEYEPPELLNKNALGYSPSPAALLDAIHTVLIKPRGFGGSSGFATRQWDDPVRSPLPQHCVVFVSALSDRCYERCLASCMAGMRVLCIEHADLGGGAHCDDRVENAADGIIESLGDGDVDWEIVTLDEISTPGSFWLNPPNPRDDEGNRVYPEKVCAMYHEERLNKKKTDEEAVVGSSNDGNGAASALLDYDMANLEEQQQPELNEEKMMSILADLDPLQ